MDEEYIDFNKFLIQDKWIIREKNNNPTQFFISIDDENNSDGIDSDGIVCKFDSLKEYFKSAGITFSDESAPIKIKPKDEPKIEPAVQFSPIPEDEQAFIPDEPVNLG